MEKDARILKALHELGLLNNRALTEEQEQMLQTALSPEEQFYKDVERLFDKQ